MIYVKEEVDKRHHLGHSFARGMCQNAKMVKGL